MLALHMDGHVKGSMHPLPPKIYLDKAAIDPFLQTFNALQDHNLRCQPHHSILSSNRPYPHHKASIPLDMRHLITQHRSKKQPHQSP